MANQVFANGMEIACKAGAGKVIAAFPDVCMTPPENPATPPGIPVPYPNTGFASDTSSGSKKVMISDKEIMLKNKSFFKKSTGDEAGSAAKKGVISSKNTGKVYFVKWSMDVKVEGENVDRHMDMTTNNHGSPTTNEGIPWTFVDDMVMSKIGVCSTVEEKIKDACDPKEKAECPDASEYVKAKDECVFQFNTLWNENLALEVGSKEWELTKKKSDLYQDARKKKNDEINKYSEKIQKSECHAALRCNLVPKEKNGKKPCCAPQTPHHIVPASQFRNPDIEGYKYNDAPCVCLEGQSQYQAAHARIHWKTSDLTKSRWADPDEPFLGEETWSAGEAENVGAQVLHEEFGCDPVCIEAQLRKMHLAMGIKKKDKIKPTAPGPNTEPAPIKTYRKGVS